MLCTIVERSVGSGVLSLPPSNHVILHEQFNWALKPSFFTYKTEIILGSRHRLTVKII